MKKITLALTLLTFGLQAQNFPAPYCDIDPEGTTVEEITTVIFAGLSIINMDASSILVDATDNVGFINQGDSSTITVTGNTVGDFDTDIVAFIDWNNNEILDDDGEVFQIGTITNSNGNDGVTVSMDIIAPYEAEFVPVRVRITKTFKDADSPAEIDPCAISFNPFGQGVFPGFGQALDFTIVVGLIGVDEFDISALEVYPSPVKDILNVNYKSALSDLIVYDLLGQEVYTNEKTGNQLQVDLSALKVGVYIVKVAAKEGTYSFKMVKE